MLKIIIFFLITSNLSAQQCEYQDYFLLADSATKDYADKNYKEAGKTLKLAFSKVEFPLGDELSMAFSVAQKTKDYEWAEVIAIQLAKGGVPLRYFSNYKQSKWYDRFSSDFESYTKYYNENFRSELRERLNSLIDIDKEFTANLMEWHNGEIELTAEDAYQEANSILAEFKAIIETYGFPTERLMGYNYVRRLNRVEYYKTSILMIHLYKYGELVYVNEIPQLICDGILHPNLQQTLNNVRGFGNSTGIEQEMKVRFEKYSKVKE
ncbi:hypothetical protein [Xanthomarina sp. F2636L]|uniref:hypothetical protein n=1 Tax=Xanthomarina sp. F2636L TaxID=2996018 RepID=UPI00225E27C8|nr:hypothetical protein [Xanthomarina sp. F2636L]MCX7550094.1 hypothetical protein [Xanthomarina sp. F2636L]